MKVAEKCCKIFPFVLGAALISIGIFLVVTQPQEKLFSTMLANAAELVDGNWLYERVWSNLDMFFKVYLFEVTNPDDVMEGQPPQFVEHGPYVYDMNVKKTVLRVDEEADEIEFTVTRTMHFNKELSKGREDDEIVMINFLYIATMGSIQNKFPSFLKKLGNDIQKLYPDMDDIFVRATAKDIMFDGLPMVCNPVKYPELKMICSFFSGNLPEGISRTDVDGVYKFSFFGTTNGSAQGPFNVNRGVQNKTRLGDTTVFRGKRVLRYWGTKECNRVHGSDSVTWAPMDKPFDYLYSYETQICRSALVDFKREDTIYGLVGRRYEFGSRAWDQELFECYCPLKKKVPICPIRGVMDLTACKDAPLYYSEPHFLHGDPALLEFAQGLDPTEELHSNFVTIEPYSGAPLAGLKTMQLNVKTFKSPVVTMLANVSEGFFPMFWIQEIGNPDIQMFAEIIQSHRFLRLTRYLIWVPIPIGIFIIIKAIVLFNVSKSDAIITPIVWASSPPTRTITVDEPERLINARPRNRINHQSYDSSQR